MMIKPLFLQQIPLKLLLILGLAMNSMVFAEQSATIIFDAEMPIVNDSKSGNYAQLASVIDLYRKKDPDTLFIFGGESLGPSILSTIDRGAHIIDILNSLQPNVMGISKRELSHQEDELILRTYEASFPIVSSNLYDPLTYRPPEGIQTHAILKTDAITLGFISVLDPDVVNKYPTDRIEVTSPEKAIIKAVIELKAQGADLIVLHYSVYTAVFDRLLQKGTVDLTLHKDQNFKLGPYQGLPHHPRNIIVKDKAHTAVIQLSWQPANLKKSLKIKYSEIDLTAVSPKLSVFKQEQEYARQLNTLLADVLGETTTPIDLRRETLRTAENGFADFVADTLKQFTSADLSLINSGTLRGDAIFPAGTILTRKDIRTMMPYRNTLKLIEATGQQITAALEHGLSGIDSTSGQYLQISGIKIKYDATRPAGERLLLVTLNNKLLSPTKTYKVATLDYLLNGGDGYTMFINSNVLNHQQNPNFTLPDLIAEKIQELKMIAPKTDGRILDISTKD
ncbi:5'-nucleotidase C-terminal domain-containing protein [Marinomonas sp. RSW2]|uniref:5'-nucleotidase C-terminal domain-containing protein n=1 Tax=Marinomonas maritima TaxID=2940935 RepID=A0ABT5WAB2_9GAMM|nr:5'-nucleotidase C-terminal domain-containing protein [Marinomonas maritima]MDE8601767.1 5'-nucleotidase C-terminal domain-containing protein [Marinomonas maritima]